MKSNKFISVIIPTYNRDFCIADSIKSVLGQTHENIEIIVIDDGGNDDTEAVVRAINDSRIIYHKLPENVGPSGARNAGVSLAKGDIIAFHDSDDICLPDRLEVQLAKMEEERADMCFFPLMKKDGIFPSEEILSKLTPERMYGVLMHMALVGGGTIMCGKEQYNDVGGFDPKMRSIEDYEFSVRFAKKYRIVFIHRPLIKTGNYSGSVNKDTEGALWARIYIFEKYYDEYVRWGLIEENIDMIMRNANACNAKTAKEALTVLLELIKTEM